MVAAADSWEAEADVGQKQLGQVVLDTVATVVEVARAFAFGLALGNVRRRNMPVVGDAVVP